MVASYFMPERGVSHLLSDLERPQRCLPQSRLAPLPATKPAEHMEDLLLDVIVTHGCRAGAIERLLGDVVGDAAIDDDAESQHALADMECDNDFDGLA